MERITVNVEITENNYSAYIDELLGCVATGDTFNELQENIKSAVNGHLEVSREFGDAIPEVFEGDFEFIFKFDTESLLTHYRGIFTNAALERMTGINQRQLQRYASGESKPRKAQAEKINNAFHKLAQELQVVSL